MHLYLQVFYYVIFCGLSYKFIMLVAQTFYVYIFELIKLIQVCCFFCIYLIFMYDCPQWQED